MKRIVFSVLLVVLLACSIVSAGFVSQDQSNDYTQELKEIKESITNYKLGIATQGLFNSDDGTTANLAETEIQEQINSYNDLIDSAYSKDNPCRSSYKDDNAYMLREVFNTPKELVRFASGILDVRIVDYDIDNNNSAADISFVSTSWSRSVEFDGSSYIPNAGASRSYQKVHMTKEDGIWKVEKSIELTPWDCSCYDEDEVKNVVSDMRSCVNYSSTFADRKSISDEEESAIRDEIKNSQQINSMTFDTFAEARDAAMTVDVVNGNYYALY